MHFFQPSGGGLGDDNVMAVEGEDGQHYVVLEVIQMPEGGDEDGGENQLGHEVDGHEGKVKVIHGSGGHPQVHKSNTEIKKEVFYLVKNLSYVMLLMCKCKV